MRQSEGADIVRSLNAFSGRFLPEKHCKRRHLTRAVDFNIPLITNASLATAFVRAFCSMTMDQVSVKTAGEY